MTPDLETAPETEADQRALGRGSPGLLADSLRECVATGSDADAVALWVGLHGVAHQQSVTVSFPWPRGVAARLVGALASPGDG